MEWHRWIDAARARARIILRPRRADKDVHDELSFHLAMQARANERGGVSATDAERRARLALGGITQVTESVRAQRPAAWMDQVRQDARYAMRTILRTKTISLAVVVTFALGIGANAAIFSLVNSVLLTPLPYGDPDRIVSIEPFFKNTGRTNPVASAPDFRDWRDQNHVFDVMAYHFGGEFRAVVDGAPNFASIQLVTPDFFPVFG